MAILPLVNIEKGSMILLKPFGCLAAGRESLTVSCSTGAHHSGCLSLSLSPAALFGAFEHARNFTRAGAEAKLLILPPMAAFVKNFKTICLIRGLSEHCHYVFIVMCICSQFLIYIDIHIYDFV